MTLASGANVQSGNLLINPPMEFGPGLAVSIYTTRNNILVRKDKLMR